MFEIVSKVSLNRAVIGVDMETVRISKVEGQVGKSGKAYYSVTLEDGRKATTFDHKVKDLSGALVGADVVQNGQWLNIKVYTVLAESDKPSSVGIPMSTPLNLNASEKARINPVFAFLGACALASPMVLDKLNSGQNVEDTVEAVKNNFAPFMELARELLKSNLEIEEYAEIADKLMD